MAALSDYLESNLLNFLFRSSTSFQKPSGIAIALTSNTPKDSDTGATLPELPSGVNRGGIFVDTNYRRLDLGNPVTSGDAMWKSVGVDNDTAFHVSGVVDSGFAIGMSGYFYPLYLSESVAISKDNLQTAVSYKFEEFPSVFFYSPRSIAKSGEPLNPELTEYEGNGFIKNNRQLIFNTALTDWGWISGIAVLDTTQHGSGNLLMFSELSNPRYVYAGDNVRFELNSLEISLK